MVKEAQSHAEEDRKRRELIDARNEADALAYSVEKTLSENEGRLAEQDRSRIQAAIADVRKAAEGEDTQVLKRSMDELQRAAQTLAELQSRQGQAKPGAGQASNVQDGEVVDAEPV